MLGYYNYTVYLTYAGLVSSFAGMFFAFTGSIRAALICLLISGVCDMFDGKIARTKKDRTAEEKRFGIQIDSLCDIVCFGIFPAFLSLTVGCTAWWQVAIAALFCVCGVIRLAYFNVTEELRQNSTDENRHTYNGVPITVSAVLVPLLMCFAKPLGSALPCAYTMLLTLLGFLYIAPVKVKKPGKAGAAVMIAVGLTAFIFILKS